MKEVLMTVDDLCNYLRLKRKGAVYMRLHRGTLPPPIRVGRFLRWRAVDVEKWLDEQKKEG